MMPFERILVTGATGFIGSALVERLVLTERIPTRAFVHSWSNAVQIAHLPVEMVCGDLSDRAAVEAALAGCDAVVHLATGGHRGFVHGTRVLVKTATRLRLRRFVHMSSTAVYGLTPPPTVQEERGPLRWVGETYCDWKIAAERRVWRAIDSGLPASILRPCIVYGPYSRWTTRTLERLAQGDYSLVDDGIGVCNGIYVENLVDAILAALVRSDAVGQAFFITDEKPTSWREFAEAHAALLTPPPDIPVRPADEVFAYHRARGGLLRRSVRPFVGMLGAPAFREVLKTVPAFEYVMAELAGRLSPAQKAFVRSLIRRRGQTPASGPPMLDLVTASVQSCRVTFSIEKARRLLGYNPRLSFSEGMALTARWLRWAGYLSSDHT